MSYVREDDAHEDGKITGIRRKLSDEVRMQTGQTFPIFQDRDDILTGERWRQRIEGSLDGTTLLIAIVTPAFLRSEACRDEVNKFREREAALRRNDLIIPVLYMDTPGLRDPDDELAVDLFARQCYDWRDLRFEDLDSAPARRGLAELAHEVVSALERSATTDAPRPVPADSSAMDADLDEPGFIELVAEAEDAMPLFTATIESLATEVGAIGEKTEEAGARMTAATASGRSAAGRLSTIHRLTRDLSSHAESMDELSLDYVEQLSRVDAGIHAMIERVPEITDVDEIEAALELHRKLADLAHSSTSGLGSLETLKQSMTGPGQLSSTLRPVLRKIAESLTRLQPSQATFEAWRDDLGAALAAGGSPSSVKGNIANGRVSVTSVGARPPRR